MVNLHWIFITLFLTYTPSVFSEEPFGSSLFQCPEGYFLSKFNTAFDGSERYYKFGCSRFHADDTVSNEVCSMSGVASSEDEDLYLSCGSDQYTAGVEILDNTSTGATTWQLLCCNSEAVTVRSSDCIDTKFVNDLRHASSFSSGTQIMRKWQAMTENNDLRWWLQLCPVDVAVKNSSVQPTQIRERRQLPRRWTRGRFPPLEFHPAYMGHAIDPLLSQEKLYEQKQMRSFEKTNEIQAVFPLAQPTLSTTTQKAATEETDTVWRFDTNDKKSSAEIVDEDKPAFVTEAAGMAVQGSKLPEKQDTALDYYDAYDDNFDKAKHEGRGSFLSGVSDLLQNLQDGIQLAQAVMPASTKPVVTTPAPLPSVMLSRDDNSLTIGLQEGGQQQFDSVVKLRRVGPTPRRPSESQSTPPPINIGDPSAIQQMLQFFGLCKGHEL